MSRLSYLATGALALAACTQVQPPQQAIDKDPGDLRGVEEIGSSAASKALTNPPTFNATTGLLNVPMSPSDNLLVVSKQQTSNAILLNGQIVTDPSGVVAYYSSGGLAPGLVKTLTISATSSNTTVAVDLLNGSFVPGVTGTFTSSTPIVQGITVDFGSCSGCSFKLRGTPQADTVTFGKDKFGSANKLIAFNNPLYNDIWVKAASSTLVAYGVGLDAGNDVFSATPSSTTLTPFTDPIAVHGGLGDDTITGGYGADTLYGDEGSNTIDESAYAGAVFTAASSTLLFNFSASGKTISVSGTSTSSFSFVALGFTSSSVLTVVNTAKNGSTSTPGYYTLTAVASSTLTVAESLVNEVTTTTSTAQFTQNTVHAKDTVYGLVGGAFAATTTVTYAARPIGRAGSGVVVKLGHDGAGAWLAGTEDNLDETIGIVIGTDFADRLSCSNATDTPCTLVGGKGNDFLTAGWSSTSTSTHRLYGGDGNDSMLVTSLTNYALLAGGNWTDATRGTSTASAVSSTRAMVFNATSKTITAVGSSTGSFINDGFLAGYPITVVSSTSNGTTAAPKTFTVTSVSTTVLTLSAADTLTAETSTTCVIKQAALVVPLNTSVDTVDFTSATDTAVDINLTAAPSSTPKFYAYDASLHSGGTGKHMNITNYVTKAICPQIDASQVCTVTGNNFGNWIVAGKGADVLTGGSGADSFDLGAFDPAVKGLNPKQVSGGTNTNGATDSVDFSGRQSTSTVDIACVSTSCKTSGTTLLDAGLTVTATSSRTLTFTIVSAGSSTITASSGSFIRDGFLPGQAISVTGTGADSNDAWYTLQGVTASTLTLNELLINAAGDPVVYTSSTKIIRNGVTVPQAVGATVVSSVARTLTFAVDNTITASSGDFEAEGFWVGGFVSVTGTVTVYSPLLITSVSTTVLTVGSPGVTLVAEGPLDNTAPVTLTLAPVSPLLEGISLVGFTSATCPSSTNHGLSCYIKGNGSSNTLDFNGCVGTVTCGGGTDFVLNAGPGVNTGCGI